MEYGYVSQVVQYIFAGLSSGSIYALVALGFNIIFNVTSVVNLAQGQFVIFGALIMISLQTAGHLPLLVSMTVSTLVVGVVGIIFHSLVIRPLKQPSIMILILLTLGGSTFFKGLALLVWGKDPLSVASFSKRQTVSVMGATFSTQILWVLGVMLIISLIFWAFLERSIRGKAMKACSENPQSASLLGINVKKYEMMSFFLSGAIGALGGMVTAPISFISYDEGLGMGLKGFVAAILGGVGSYPGAVVGGLVLGLLEVFSTAYVSSIFKDIIAFLVLISMLVIRPTGLLKKAEEE